MQPTQPRARRTAALASVYAVLLAFAAAGVLAQAARPIDQDVLRERIAALASERMAGRKSGTPGNDEAARYVAAAFRKAGLKPLGTSHQGGLKSPLNGSGFFQPFSFASGVARGSKNKLEAVVAGKRTGYRAGAEFEPAGLSASGAAEGEAVFAGYAIDSREPARDDFAGVEVKDKVLVALAGVPPGQSAGPLAAFAGVRRKAMAARDRGAAALVVVLPQDVAVPPVESDNGADAGIPVVLARRPVAAAWAQAAGQPLDEVEKALAQGTRSFATGVLVKLTTDVQKVTRTTANVIGLLPGSDPALKEEVVVIGAHLDHLGMGGPGSLADQKTPAIHPGADDNASGTAAVMAAADVLAGAGRPPRRSMLFICFSGEELGLLGAQHYVRNPVVPLERTVAMLNMDMVGRLAADNLTVGGVGTSPGWQALLNAANADSRLNVVAGDGAFASSDHHAFYTRNVPVLFFFTGVHADYHKPSDTADKINVEGLARIAGLVVSVARRVADADERPAFTQVASAQPSGPTRFRASLGTIPEYASDVEGVPLSGVRPGSPADKAGLKAGDIIVKFGDRTVRNIQEYTEALSERKPGDTVAITVRRGAETVTVHAVLAESTRR